MTHPTRTPPILFLRKLHRVHAAQTNPFRLRTQQQKQAAPQATPTNGVLAHAPLVEGLLLLQLAAEVLQLTPQPPDHLRHNTTQAPPRFTP